MKKKILLIAIIAFTALYSFAQQEKQRVLSECTVDYIVDISEAVGLDNSLSETFKATTKTVYIKGNQSRVDFKSPSFSQSVIYDKKTGDAVILREIGGNKFLTNINADSWKKKNGSLDNATVQTLEETKTILGYDCKKAVLTLADGTSLHLFYVPNFVPSVKEFEYQFKNVPGFVLEYESQDKNGQKIKYTATKINLNPVSTTKFDIPTSGYRILNE
ncbi:MAG: hypothetical protein KF781_00980 [Chitinophagaceae bacterium]|nr:hypothetical protein [Chitinophagaceae bacterium]MCW5905309.1 hypothetical protein [Chitinophagaceae bacterium]